MPGCRRTHEVRPRHVVSGAETKLSVRRARVMAETAGNKNTVVDTVNKPCLGLGKPTRMKGSERQPLVSSGRQAPLTLSHHQYHRHKKAITGRPMVHAALNTNQQGLNYHRTAGRVSKTLLPGGPLKALSMASVCVCFLPGGWWSAQPCRSVEHPSPTYRSACPPYQKGHAPYQHVSFQQASQQAPHHCLNESEYSTCCLPASQ